ncbi:extracellular solute-binding protein [Paenibacillus alba]|uniref:Extracellular solute-binding protein n=1 Tax=Paenibacillus alba TaxID=1197127 RepID=A0ABU6G3G6_9BACL|nr:extracellular solute-binding protein [Paenibacillus alba]MEC0228707.1 extracellular solute-binding protein [Paenibacillus alba]
MRKKQLSMVTLSVSLSLTLALSACSSKPEATSQPTAEASKGKFDKKLTITAFNSGAFNPGSQMPAREDDPIRQMLEKAVNVDFQMTIPPADQQLAKLNTMIASGDIPDLIFMTSRATAVEYYNQGILADLDKNDLNNYPDLQNRFKPEDWESMKYKGKTIGTPGYELVSGVRGWWLRNDWLTKLNLKAPTTPDELLEVMKAFTFKDPDGNGKNDTYGFAAGVGKDGSLITLGWEQIFWMFGVNPTIVDQVGGKLVFGNTDPRMKEALAFINKMLEAKVVDPDWVSINEAPAIDKKMYSGKIGIIINDWRRMEKANSALMKELSGEIPDWQVIAPPKGPNGDQTIGLKAFQNNSWAISKTAAKDPEKLNRILALLQYWYTDKDFYPWASYGLKTIGWDNVSGSVQRIQENLASKEISEKYRWTSNYSLPRRTNDDLFFNFTNPKTAEFQKINLTYVKANTTNPYILPDPTDTKLSERNKFTNESLLKFMMGKDPLTKWDDYLAALDSKFDYAKYKDLVAKQLTEAGVMK